MSGHDENLRILFNFFTSSETSFVKSAINCIIAECLDQLYILRDLIGQCDVVFSENIIEYRSLQERYMDVEDHGAYRINLKTTNFDKIAIDINNLTNILKCTLQELNSLGTFLLMEKCTSAMKNMHKDDNKLLEDVEKNDKYIEELHKQCEKERLDNIKTIEETNDEIQKVRFDVEEADCVLYIKQETNFFNKWESARREQNDLTCGGAEKAYTDVINNMTEKMKLETKVHLELEKYLKESTDDFLQEIDYWMHQIDEQSETRDIEIMNLKMDLEKLNSDLSQIRESYRTRTAAIEDWLTYKKIKAEKEALAERERLAAIKIQAWWRGVMYRRKLGPYRKKKKGKGKKGNTKKKK